MCGCKGQRRRDKDSCLQGSKRAFILGGCRSVWQVCSGVVVNDFSINQRPFLGLSWLHVSSPMLAVRGICQWVCGRLV